MDTAPSSNLKRASWERACRAVLLYYGVFVPKTRLAVHSFFRLVLLPSNMSKVDVVMGSQWGDEGKGKLVDTIGDRCAALRY